MCKSNSQLKKRNTVDRLVETRFPVREFASRLISVDKGEQLAANYLLNLRVRWYGLTTSEHHEPVLVVKTKCKNVRRHGRSIDYITTWTKLSRSKGRIWSMRRPTPQTLLLADFYDAL